MRKTKKQTIINFLFFICLINNHSLIYANTIKEESMKFDLLNGSESIPITILTTNDLHSHVEGSGPDSYLNFENSLLDPVKGHYARLTTEIQSIKDQKRSENEAVLLFDLGDYSSGTLFHNLSISNNTHLSPEMEFFKTNEYNAITLGNHEFDAGETGLATMLNKVSSMNYKLNIISTNIRLKKRGSPLEKFFFTGNNSNPNIAQIHQNFLIKTQSKGKEIKIGVLGASGPDAALTSKYSRTHTSFVGFQDLFLRKKLKSLTDLLNKHVTYLKKKHNPDMIILLYHGGNPEDIYISENVPGLNLILSGHTHKTYFLKVNGVYISQCGCYGEKLGKIELEVSNGIVNAKRNLTHYVPITSSTPPHNGYLERINEYKSELKKFDRVSGYEYDTFLGHIDKDYERKKSLGDPLGRFVTSGVLNSLNSELPSPVDVYFGNIGAIRSGIPIINKCPTRLQYSDVYRMLSLGFDEHLQSGSRICGFYLTPHDFKKFVEFSEFATKMHKEFKALFSDNITYSLNKNGLPLVNGVKNLKLNGVPIESYKRLIHFATNEILGEYFPSIRSLTKGFLKIRMRDSLGNEIRRAPILSESREHVLFAKYIEELEKQRNQFNFDNIENANDINRVEEHLYEHADAR